MSVLLLSRIQFALNISFHYLFPPLSIGLGVLLVVMEGLYLITKKQVYANMTRFWVKIFAIIFSIGVATGLVQVFGFGTNWSRFSCFVGNIFGSILGAEGIFAFFLESGFLAVLLFGWNKVSHKIHFLSTILVTCGAHFSAVWIVTANSWMQTPAGYKIITQGTTQKVVMTDFLQVLFNPSAINRLIHVILGAWLAGEFLVISVSAFYLLKNKHLDVALRSFKISLVFASITIILQLLSGDASARGVAKHQPSKLAAFEGVYHTQPNTGMWVVGLVKSAEKRVVGVFIPRLLSLLVHRNTNPVQGLDRVDSNLWPPVAIVFQTYHGMIMMWGLMALAVALGMIAWGRNKLLTSKRSMRFLVISVLFPELGNQLGWFSAEIGRQPWVVYGLLKTSDGVTPHLQKAQVIFSLILFCSIYVLIFILFIYLINRKIQIGPESTTEEYHVDK